MPPLIDPQAIFKIQVVLPLPVLPDDSLGHLGADLHPAALSHLHYVLKRQLPIVVCKILVDTTDGLCGQGLALLLGL